VVLDVDATGPGDTPAAPIEPSRQPDDSPDVRTGHRRRDRHRARRVPPPSRRGPPVCTGRARGRSPGYAPAGPGSGPRASCRGCAPARNVLHDTACPGSSAAPGLTGDGPCPTGDIISELDPLPRQHLQYRSSCLMAAGPGPGAPAGSDAAGPACTGHPIAPGRQRVPRRSGCGARVGRCQGQHLGRPGGGNAHGGAARWSTS
jgi:hypothetical protein